MPEIIIVLRDGSDRIIDTDPEYSLMEAIRDAGVDEMLAMCGGCCSCATCHVYIEESGGDLSEPSADEDDLLDSTGCRTSQSRLACQVRLAELTIKRARIAPED